MNPYVSLYQTIGLILDLLKADCDYSFTFLKEHQAQTARLQRMQVIIFIKKIIAANKNVYSQTLLARSDKTKLRTNLYARYLEKFVLAVDRYI